MRYLIVILSILTVAGQIARQPSRQFDKQQEFAYLAFDQDSWWLKFCGANIQDPIHLESDPKILPTTKKNVVYGVNNRGRLITVDVTSRQVRSTPIAISGKPIGVLNRFDVAWGRNKESIMVFDFKEWNLLAVSPQDGSAKVLLDKRKFKLLTKRPNLDIYSYWSGGAISPTGEIAISVPSDRMLFHDGIDHDSDVYISSGIGRMVKIIEGAPVAWIDDQQLLTITTLNGHTVVRVSNLRGSVSWERKDVVWGSVFEKNLVIVEKDDLSKRYKLTLFSLPGKKFVKEFDLGQKFGGFMRSVVLLH